MLTPEQKIDKILMHIEGDTKTKTKGLVERTSILEDRVDFLYSEKRAAKVVIKTLKWVWGFLGAILTGLLWVLSKLWGNH